MLKSKIYQTALLVGLASVSLSALSACNKQPEVLTADSIQAGAMPEGGEWEGVYYNQTFGFLHVTSSGSSAQGTWKTTAGDKWGELYGEVEGDLVRFSWTEYTIGVVGPNAKSEGHGYFRYIIPNPDEAHELKGEWGLGDNALGHSWDCVKQTNMEPDPDSVRPNEVESAVGAVGFDGAKGDDDLSSDEQSEEEGEEKKPSEEAEEDPL